MIFEGWSGILRTVVVGVLAYAALVALVRIAGKRTLGKMNAFDLVVTVALGSTLATILLSKEVPLLDGVVAFALLIGLQLTLTWLSVRSSLVARLVKSEPSLLAFRGQLLRERLRRERVTDEEVLQALRSRGFASVSEAHAVVLETDGTLSVVRASGGSGDAPVLANVDEGDRPGSSAERSTDGGASRKSGDVH